MFSASRSASGKTPDPRLATRAPTPVPAPGLLAPGVRRSPTSHLQSPVGSLSPTGLMATHVCPGADAGSAFGDNCRTRGLGVHWPVRRLRALPTRRPPTPPGAADDPLPKVRARHADAHAELPALPLRASVLAFAPLERAARRAGGGGRPAVPALRAPDHAPPLAALAQAAAAAHGPAVQLPRMRMRLARRGVPPRLAAVRPPGVNAG